MAGSMWRRVEIQAVLEQGTGRLSLKQMGLHAQPPCSPFPCQVTTNDKCFLLPGRAIHQLTLRASEVYMRKEEELRFREHEWE